jgi:hypothetical protein
MGNLEHPRLFGDWLKARRRALDLTQEELAQRGCSIFALRKIEAGERRAGRARATVQKSRLSSLVSDWYEAQFNSSARAYHRTRSVKLARTIADLVGCEEVDRHT